MSYLALKHIHVTLVVISVLFFILRFFWRSIDAQVAKQKWVKIAPHIIDTLLLVSIVALLWQGLMLGSAWYMQKTIGLIGYIVFGIIAMRASTPVWRYTAFFVALGWIMVLLHVAYTKVPLFAS
jgi:uncharacterized membrane protein SirB2